MWEAERECECFLDDKKQAFDDKYDNETIVEVNDFTFLSSVLYVGEGVSHGYRGGAKRTPGRGWSLLFLLLLTLLVAQEKLHELATLRTKNSLLEAQLVRRCDDCQGG